MRKIYDHNALITVIFLSLLCILKTPLPGQSSWPKIIVKNDQLIRSGTGERFFLAGLVDNTGRSGMQLSQSDLAEMESLMIQTVCMGGNTIRWNAFLYGRDFQWEEDGLVKGLTNHGFQTLKNGLDLAEEYGLMVQVVLSTAHFLQWGWGGESNIFNGYRNDTRVENNYRMFATEEGIQAYLDHIIIPMCDTIGQHDALFGFLLGNEAYGMASSTPFGDGWAENKGGKLIDDKLLMRFYNRVSGELHRQLPGVLCGISSIAKNREQFTSSSLMAQGNDPDGILDFYQYQYYPKNHSVSQSPFMHSPEDLAQTWGGSNELPAIVGEFWFEGITNQTGTDTLFSTGEAYKTLWQKGYGGGFGWSDYHFLTSIRKKKEMLSNSHSMSSHKPIWPQQQTWTQRA